METPMRSRPRRAIGAAIRVRRGFTLLEMILSMSLLLAIVGMSTQLFRKQSGAVSSQYGTLDAQQNSRFSISSLDRELRMAGVNVVDAQPMIVAATATSIVFSSDLAANDTGDYAAVYINPDVDSASVGVMKPADKFQLPGTSFTYPDSLYKQVSGIQSNAETIMYYLLKDSTTTASNEYLLMRRVNARPASVVARNIIYNTGDTLFQFLKSDTAGTLSPIPQSSLPLVHTSAVHGANADTGKFALTDSIRVVRVRMRSVFHDLKLNQDVFREIRASIRVMNAGLTDHSTCGNPPIAVTPNATVVPAGGGVPATYVQIDWPKSTDDGTGEKDVERYVLYRRLSTVTTFDQPFASVPAGGATGTPPKYLFKDTDVQSGQKWVYGVAAQDCTPLISTVGTASVVTIP
jgi:prepilin-type N-terminal cleavage/methylation domain-containing protein